MKRLHVRFGETLTRLLGGRQTPSSARMEAAIGRVWDRLQAEIGDTPADVASRPVGVRVGVRGGLISSFAYAFASLLWRSVMRLRGLRHGGPFANH